MGASYRCALCAEWFTEIIGSQDQDEPLCVRCHIGELEEALEERRGDCLAWMARCERAEAALGRIRRFVDGDCTGIGCEAKTYLKAPVEHAPDCPWLEAKGEP